MAVFEYQASDPSGNVIKGEMEAKDRAAVIKRLQSQRFYPLRVNQKVEKKGLSTEISLKDIFSRITSKDVMNFTHQLAALTDAGLPLDRSLRILANLAEKPRLKAVLEDIVRNVEGGSTFADALARHPKLFNRLYINMVRSGEAGGVLEKILVRLAEFMESTQELKSEVVSALIYPVILVFVGGAAVAMLITYVVPKFARIFEDMHAAIPLPTLILLDLANFLKMYYWAIILGILFFAVLFRYYLRTESGRYNFDVLSLKLPIIKDLITKMEVSRFSRTLGTLYRNGVPLLQALSITKEILGNEVIKKSITEVYSGIKEGSGIAEPLGNSGVFPPLSIHMLEVGEETGNLEDMLLKIADTYENEVKVAVNRAARLLEPMMIIIMGVVVGFIVVSMLYAIFSVNDIPM